MIVLESCSKFQTLKRFSKSSHNCNEKNFLVLVFFVNDVKSGVVSGLFAPLHLALDPNC